jgi:hypothetical protein
MSASFALDLKKFADKTKAKNGLVIAKVVGELAKQLVLKSPVGDGKYWKNPPPPGYVGGRFRANWQYGLEAPDLKTTDAIDAAGAGTISSIVGKISTDGAGNVHYLTNNLPYAEALENGHSHRQAPNGIVHITVLEFQPIVDRIARSMGYE